MANQLGEFTAFDPNVFDAVGYDPERSGPFAGLTRLHYNFAIPEYDNQTFARTLGKPWRRRKRTSAGARFHGPVDR